MAAAFSADEVFAVAERIECNGAAFYRAAADRFIAQRQLLQALAQQEDGHLAVFAGMRKRLSGPEREAPSFDPDNEAALYLRTMADSKVFDIRQKPSDLLDDKHTLGEILGLAIGKEKESIVFYTAMKAVVPPDLGQDKLDLIIREEFKHIAFLIRTFEEQCAPTGKSSHT